MLTINNLKVAYGGIQAIRGISLEVPEGQIVTLIGANGAGKSTTLRSVVGLVKPYEGEIIFNGTNLVGMPTHKIIGSGISTVPEGRKIFSDLSVLENLRIGAYLRNNEAEIRADIDMVYDLFPRLKERSWQQAGTLSGGEQQMLAVGRALMGKPRLMLMDEPSLGLAPMIVQDIFSIIKRINQEGVTILLIEQNANMALRTADYAYVLETGHILMEGPGKELLADENIRSAYLGKKKD